MKLPNENDDADAMGVQFERTRDLLDAVADSGNIDLGLYRVLDAMLGLVAMMYAAATKPVMLDLAQIPGLAEKVGAKVKEATGEKQNVDPKVEQRFQEQVRRAYL